MIRLIIKEVNFFLTKYIFSFKEYLHITSLILCQMLGLNASLEAQEVVAAVTS